MRHDTFVTAKRELSVQPRPKFQRSDKATCHDPSKAQTRDAQLKIASFIRELLGLMVSVSDQRKRASISLDLLERHWTDHVREARKVK